MDFAEAGFAVQLALAFGGGVVAFLSPCVLPLLPGYLGLMSGYSVASLQAGEASRARMLRVTLLFVAGFTVVFVATGAIATQVSQFLVGNQTVINRVAGSLILTFGLLMVAMAFTSRGFLSFFSQERRLEVRPSRLGNWAPPVMGLAFGFGWTPCIGPILGGVLLVASTQETVGNGMLLLAAFSLGLGVPFVASGLAMSRAMAAVKGFRRWMRPVTVVGGVVMAAFGVIMLTGNVGWLSGQVTELFVSVPWLQRLAEI
jgi:cytochrome c-type biogenesis protein